MNARKKIIDEFHFDNFETMRTARLMHELSLWDRIKSGNLEAQNELRKYRKENVSLKRKAHKKGLLW